MSKLRSKALLLGIVSAILVEATWSLTLAFSLSTSAAQFDAASGRLLLTSPYSVLSLLGIVISALLGGWIAARLAPAAETWNSIGVGVVLVVLSAVFFLPIRIDRFPIEYSALAFLLTVVSAWLGGGVQLMRAGRK